MTPVTLLFGTLLFLLLLFVFGFLLSTQPSPQSAMLEQVALERRLRRKALGIDGASSVFVDWVAKPLGWVRSLFSQQQNPVMVRRLANAGYRQPAHADFFWAAGLAPPAILCVVVALVIQDGLFIFLIVAGVLGFFAPDFWLAQAINRRKSRIDSSLPDALD